MASPTRTTSAPLPANSASATPNATSSTPSAPAKKSSSATARGPTPASPSAAASRPAAHPPASSSAETRLRREKSRDPPPRSAWISSPQLATGRRRQERRLAQERAPVIRTTFHDHPEPTDHNQQQHAAEQKAADGAVALRIGGSAMGPPPPNAPHFPARFRVTDLVGPNRRARFAPPIFRQLAHSLPFVTSAFSRPDLLPAAADRPAPASSACGLIKWNPRTSSCPSGARPTAIRSPNTSAK